MRQTLHFKDSAILCLLVSLQHILLNQLLSSRPKYVRRRKSSLAELIMMFHISV